MKIMFLFAVILFFSFNIVNAAQITPANPTDEDDMTCDAISVDSTTIYKWYKNNALYATNSNPDLSASATVAGQEWHCEVWALHYIPYVGTVLAPKETSTRVIIAAADVDSPEEEVNPIVIISPENPYTIDDLVCDVDVSGNYIYKWYKNNRYYSSVKSSILPSSKTVAGQEWHCQVYSQRHIPYVGLTTVEVGKSEQVPILSMGPNSPGAPVPLYPIDGNYITTVRPFFNWSDSIEIDGDDVDYELYLDGSLVAITTNNVSEYLIDYDLAQGYHSWRVKAIDEFGHESLFSDLVGFYVDSVAPNIYNFVPLDYYQLNSDMTFNFNTNENAVCEIDVAEFNFSNGQIFDTTGGQTHEHTYGGLVSGAVDFYFVCQDLRGWNSTYNVSYYVDLEDPVITQISPNNGTMFNVDNVLVNITTNENTVCKYDYISGFNFSDGMDFDVTNGFEHRVNITGNINPGLNTYYYLCMDDAGRISAKNASTFYVDSFGPQIISFNYTNESYVLSNDFDLSLETDKNATCYYDFNSGILFNSSTIMNYTSNLTLNTTVHNVSFQNLAQGENEFYFKCQSYLGVNSTVEKLVLFVDTIDPVLTFIEPINGSKLTNETVTLIVNVSEESYCSYSDGIDTFNFVGLNDSFTKNITLVDGDYTYHFNCTDLAGRESLVNQTNFSINTQIPVLYNFSNNVSFLSDFNVSFNTASNATCYYADNSNVLFNSSSVLNLTNGFSHRQNFSLADGEYTYYFKCEDTFGLNSSVEEFSFAVDNASLDIITIIPNGVVEEQNVTFTLETNRDSTCYYSDDIMNVSNLFSNTSGVLHNTTVNLIDGDYTYYFKCENVYGRNSSTNETSFTINSLVPTITFVSPSAGSKLDNNTVLFNITTNKQVACEINNSDFIYGNGFDMITSNNLTHTNETLNLAEGDYEFKIICTDGYYNVSENVTFEVDALKPNITIQNITLNVSEFIYGEIIEVNVTLNNTGDDNLTDDMNITVELNGIIENLVVSELNVGNLTNYTFIFDLDFITSQNLNVYVDTKTNQENNLSNSSILIAPEYVDLVLSDFLVNQTNQSLDENRTFNITLTNYGTLEALDANVSMFVNGILYENQSVNVAGNDIMNLSFEWNSTDNSGVNEIKFVVNELQDVLEYNFSNNELITNHTVFLPGEKDVEFRTLQIYSNSTQYWLGKIVELNFEVENLRNDSINNVQTNFYVDGVLNQTQFVNVLGNSLFNVTYQFVPNKTGTYNYSFEILNVTSFDSLIDNNLTQEIVVWQEVYDLEINNLDYNLSSSTIYQGNNVRYFADLINNGNVSVDASVKLRDNGNQVGLNTYLVENESLVEVSFTKVMNDKGFRTIRILTDLLDNEVDVTNNFKEMDVRVWGLDEVISSGSDTIYMSDYAPLLNENITIYYPIQNKHSDLAFSDLTIGLDLPGSFVVNQNYLNVNLSPGEYKVLSWEVNVSNISGTFDVGVIIEGNNTFVNTREVVVS